MTNWIKVEDQYDYVMILSKTYSTREIAKKLNIPKSTVSYMIRRTL